MDNDTNGGFGDQLFVDYDPESCQSIHVNYSEIINLKRNVNGFYKRDNDSFQITGDKDLLPTPSYLSFGAKKNSTDTNNNVYIKHQLELDESFEQKMNEVYEGMIKQKERVLRTRSNFYLQSPIARSSPLKVRLGKEPTEPQDCVKNYQNYKNQNLNTFILTKLANSNKKCSVLAPGSYTWKGFGGLQRNTGRFVSEESHFDSKMGNSYRISTPKRRSEKRVSLLKRPGRLSTSGSHSQQPNVYKSRSCAPVIPNLKGPSSRCQEIKYFLPLASKRLVQARRIPVYDPSGVLLKKSEELQKKSEVERERRMELAMHRENLRKLLPSIKNKKVTSLAVLDAAREYCLEIQNQFSELEDEKFEQEKKRETLLWIVTKMKFQLNLQCVLQNKCLQIQTVARSGSIEVIGDAR